MILIAVLWAVYLSECFVRWRPGDWVFRRTVRGTWIGIDRPDLTLSNERFAFVRTSGWPGDPALRFNGEDLDAESCRARLDRVRRNTRALRLFAILLFLVLLVLFPALILSERLLPWLWPLAAAVVLTWSATLITFFHTHRHVTGRAPTFEVALTQSLSPVSLIDSPSVVMLDASALTHPVAAAHVLCDEEEFLRIARLWLFDAPHMHARIEAMAAARGVLPKLKAPPEATEAGVAGYCPRCHATFRAAAEVCADCKGVTLVALQSADASVESSFCHADKTIPDIHGSPTDLRLRARVAPAGRPRRRARNARRGHRRQAS